MSGSLGREPAELPPVSQESVFDRILLESVIVVCGPKKGARLVMEINRRMMALDTVSNVQRIRPASQDEEVLRARQRAKALWAARVPQLLLLVRKLKHREGMTR